MLLYLQDHYPFQMVSRHWIISHRCGEAEFNQRSAYSLTIANSQSQEKAVLKKARILQNLINYAITVILIVLSAVEEDWYTSHIDAGDSVANPKQFIYPAVSVLLITLVSLGYLKLKSFRRSSTQRWTLLQFADISWQHTDGDPLVTDNGSAERDDAIQETSKPENLPHPRSSTKVEESKKLLPMVLICMGFLSSGLVYSIGNTFFLDQAKDMNTRIGMSKYKIPLQGFLILANVSSLVTKKLYTNRLQKYGKKYSPAIEYAIGMVLSALCCTTASWIAMEVFQRKDAESKITAFLLIPQFLLFGAMDGLARDGIKGFFSGQLPDPVKNYAVAFTEGIIGAGHMFATILVLVTKATTNWFNDKEGKNRLDKFYLLLTVVAIIIFFGYTLVAVKYPCAPIAINEDGNQPDDQEKRDDIEEARDQEEGRIKQETDTDRENTVEEDQSQNDDEEEGINKKETDSDRENRVEEDQSQNDDEEEGINKLETDTADWENKVEEDRSQNDDEEKGNKQEPKDDVRLDMPEVNEEDFEEG